MDQKSWRGTRGVPLSREIRDRKASARDAQCTDARVPAPRIHRASYSRRLVDVHARRRMQGSALLDADASFAFFFLWSREYQPLLLRAGSHVCAIFIVSTFRYRIAGLQDRHFVLPERRMDLGSG